MRPRGWFVALLVAGGVAGSAIVVQSGNNGSPLVTPTPTATPTATPGSGVGPNTTAARVFVAVNGNDAGANCRRYNPATNTPPAANTACATSARAYELMSNGDTAWVLAGDFGSTHQFDFEDNAPASFKTSVGTDCDAAGTCFYFIPQPGQEANVDIQTATNGNNSPAFSPDVAPDNLYFANFQGPRMCPGFNSGSNTTWTGFHQDITATNITGTDCTLYIKGPWRNIRITHSDISYNCDTEGTAGGSAIQANDNFSSDGESDEHLKAPAQVLIAYNYIHDFEINGCGPPGNPHQDCIHVYALTDSTFRGNVFNNCYDSSILFGGFDEAGYDENMVVENNWFGPTILGVNNCCLRGDESNPSVETFDGYLIRFNSFVGGINNKDGNVLNDVQFIGNVSTGGTSCGGSGTGQVWAYNVMGGSGCTTGGAGNLINQNTTQIGFVNTTAGALDLNLTGGSAARLLVPGAQANGCASVAIDRLQAARPSPCSAGAVEP